MFEELQQIIPAPPSPIITETFAAIASTNEFYQEVKGCCFKRTSADNSVLRLRIAVYVRVTRPLLVCCLTKCLIVSNTTIP